MKQQPSLKWARRLSSLLGRALEIALAVREEMRARIRAQRGADPGVRQHFEQERALDAAVDDMHGAHAFAYGGKRRRQPRKHSSLHRAVAQQSFGLARR